MQFTTLEELQKSIPDEIAARKFLAELRWGKFAKCPHCGNERAYFTNNGASYKCANKSCYKKFSVTSKTLLHATNVSLEKWIYGIFLFAKSRGRICHFDLCKYMSVSEVNEFYIHEKLEFAWKFVNTECASFNDKLLDFFQSIFNSYERFQLIRHEPYYKNPFHIYEIDNLSDSKQYNLLLRYTKYYIHVYCTWIFMDFGSAGDVLAEMFIRMKDEKINEYNAETIIRQIQKQVNLMWFKYLDEHPKYSNLMRGKRKQWKSERIANMHSRYIVELIAAKKGNKLTRREIEGDKTLIEEYRKDLSLKRQGIYKKKSTDILMPNGKVMASSVKVRVCDALDLPTAFNYCRRPAKRSWFHLKYWRSACAIIGNKFGKSKKDINKAIKRYNEFRYRHPKNISS